MNNDLISREALKKEMEKADIKAIDNEMLVDMYEKIVDNAPTINPCKDCEDKRPQGERVFIEILAQNVPEDLCTYPEYKGKPYYSIHYKENGEEFVGFGTYNPEVLSRYLRDYFIKGGAE